MFNAIILKLDCVTTDYANIAQRITRARELAGLSQAELSRRVGVTRSAVCHWEAGNVKNIRLSHLIKLLDVLHIRLEWLVTGRGDMAPDLSNAAEQLARHWESLTPRERSVIQAALDAFGKDDAA